MSGMTFPTARQLFQRHCNRLGLERWTTAKELLENPEDDFFQKLDSNEITFVLYLTSSPTAAAASSWRAKRVPAWFERRIDALSKQLTECTVCGERIGENGKTFSRQSSNNGKSQWFHYCSADCYVQHTGHSVTVSGSAAPGANHTATSSAAASTSSFSDDGGHDTDGPDEDMEVPPPASPEAGPEVGNVPDLTHVLAALHELTRRDEERERHYKDLSALLHLLQKIDDRGINDRANAPGQWGERDVRSLVQDAVKACHDQSLIAVQTIADDFETRVRAILQSERARHEKEVKILRKEIADLSLKLEKIGPVISVSPRALQKDQQNGKDDTGKDETVKNEPVFWRPAGGWSRKRQPHNGAKTRS